MSFAIIAIPFAVLAGLAMLVLVYETAIDMLES